jgi:hypothetical protein
MDFLKSMVYRIIQADSQLIIEQKMKKAQKQSGVSNG